jgi:solute carrier family 25 S-adenosylmethionine transporter 26
MNFMAFPSGFVYFTVYENMKYHMEKRISYWSHPSMCHLLGGSLGECSSILMRNPFEVVKQQMQLGLDTRVRDTFSHIYKLRGFKGTLF